MLTMKMGIKATQSVLNLGQKFLVLQCLKIFLKVSLFLTNSKINFHLLIGNVYL